MLDALENERYRPNVSRNSGEIPNSPEEVLYIRSLQPNQLSVARAWNVTFLPLIQSLNSSGTFLVPPMAIRGGNGRTIAEGPDFGMTLAAHGPIDHDATALFPLGGQVGHNRVGDMGAPEALPRS